MRKWLETWRYWIVGVRPPDPEPRERPEAPRAMPDWRAELLNETSLNWTGALGNPIVPEPEAPAAAAPTLPEPEPPTGPDLALPRAAFTMLGFEPGTRPPNFMAYRGLMQRVYAPCLEQLATLVVADTALFGAIETWPTAPPTQRLKLVHILFERLSAHTGAVFRFRPAPLTLGRRMRQGLLACYTEDEQRVILMDVLLQSHVAQVVTTIVHEQLHRLQHEKVLALRSGKLSLAERSLALYWEREGVADYAKDYMAYRYNGREYQAHQLSQALGLRLCQVFGWPMDHRIL